MYCANCGKKLEENEKFFKNPKVKIKKFNDSDNGIMLHRN